MPAPDAFRHWRIASIWLRGRQLPDGVHDPQFLPLAQRIAGGPLHAVSSTDILTDGANAFARMLQAINAARDEVLLETYILRDDRIGQAVQTALIDAAVRGVRVYVLADALGSFSTRERFWDGLTAAGVTVRHFHPLWRNLRDSYRRDHRKLLLIDRAVAFTGGMNIGEEYGSSLTHHPDAWRDSFIVLDGSIVQELAAVFAEGWDRAGGPDLPGLEYVSWDRGIIRRRGRVRRRRSVQQPVASDGALVLAPRPGRGQGAMARTLALLAGAARERLWITTPYFAPPWRALRMLGAAAARGVDVRLLLPGPRTDVPIVRHAAHGAYGALMRRGVQIFEYQRATLHAKTLVVDGQVSLIGSSNLDFRSLWLNAECNVLLVNTACAARLEAIFLQDSEHSEAITPSTWRERTRSHQLLDWSARQLRWMW
ncbi:MAG: hypothetical protein RLZZ621_1210 [Gemmatimonadota bacterium]|jgi:cardiolipin synthase